ncbi:RNA-binding Raly-like protein [Cheilinus undulatus]|uniref:RNA-binding Raly-like protein n=1 Tax=Cheilinus undulatus TaxID=241271 RepID=UPI001BD49E8B|nr:RNA-binding Raly-like protein [Cheilinus undulatus]
MTHFRSDCHRDRYVGMNGELRVGRNMTAKRGNSAPDRSDYEVEFDRYPEDHYSSRVYDYQRVPSSVPVDPSPVKRSRPSSSSSSSSSSTAALRRKSSRASSRSNNMHGSSSSSDSKLKMAELLAIKRELTVIKVQIDGLLDCVDKMDRQRKDCTECIQSVCDSPHRGSVSSLERESPEPGEASEEEPLNYNHYYPHNYSHRIKEHQSDLEDDL